MSRKRRKQKKQKTYLIKLPLFIIPLRKEDKGLFGALTDTQMVETLKQQLESFPITELPSRGKSKKTHITSVTPDIVNIGGKIALLVKASVFDSNLDDTYLNDGSNKSKIAKTSKLGGENYFILFYPQIEGQDSDKYVYTWLQVVYEDPTHTTGVATAVAKKLVQSKINTESFNVKLQSAIDDFKAFDYCPEVQIKLVTVAHNGESEYPQFKQYLTKSYTTKQRTYTFANMPKAQVESLLRDKKDNGEVTIHKKAIFGKKEYRVKRERHDEAEGWRETVEQLFNSIQEVSQDDVESGRIFQQEFVINAFKSVIKDYLNNG